MASTTLMTFLLCVGPHVKSVKLLGSWDNFSKTYYMERDRRIGSGHWRGCHTFTDIICDGSPNHMGLPRSGGLKMGGTYWYYYLLDDDIEYYNEAEPVTSQCPLLPGQPVNVLHVPIILPDTRPTHTGERISNSRKTDQRTMNPDDKYMNPRRPPKPKLPRLQTSPPLLQHAAWTFNSSPLGVVTSKCSSQPGSATPVVRNHDISKGLSCKASRSVSPPRSRGLRAAFRHWNASSPELGASNDQDDHNIPPFVAHDYTSSHSDGYEYGVRPHSQSGSKKPMNRTEKGPDDLHCWPTPTGISNDSKLSVQERRALNPTDIDLTPRRNPLTLQTTAEMTTPRSQRTFKPHSQMVKKSTVGYYPFLTAATLSMPSEPDATTPTPFTFREKRLPTLPNTPSSVMDEALRIIDEREQALDAENMGSHFSDFSPTEGSIASSSPCERSRFSEWSTDTELISPASMMSSLTVNNDSQSPIPDQMAVPDLLDHNATTESSDPDTPHLTMNSKSSHTSLSGDPYFDLPRPRLTVSLSPSNLDVPGLCIHDEDPVETNTKRHAAFFGEIESVEVLGLTRSPEPTAMHFPEAVKENMLSVCDEPQGPTIGEEHYRSRRATVASQSVTMQEMMDELGYLKDIIQLGTTGDI